MRSSAMKVPMASVALVMKLLTPRLHRHSLTVQESLGEISHRAQENFSGIRVVKGYDREDQQAGLFSGTSQDNRDNQVRLGDARGLTHAYIHTAFGATFAIITVALISGAIADRAKFGSWMVFAGLWATLVYFPAAAWVFGAAALSFAVQPTALGDVVGGYGLLVATLLTAVTLGCGFLAQSAARTIDARSPLAATRIGNTGTGDWLAMRLFHSRRQVGG